MSKNPPPNHTDDITDVRPLSVAMAVSQTAIAVSAVVYVIYQIFICGCN